MIEVVCYYSAIKRYCYGWFRVSLHAFSDVQNGCNYSWYDIGNEQMFIQKLDTWFCGGDDE